MREIVFRVTAERPGHLEATAERPQLTVSAGTQEEWHHEARDTLIRELGPTHITYRIRLRRGRDGHLTDRSLDRIPAAGGGRGRPSLIK
jgi:hypothetical protein